MSVVGGKAETRRLPVLAPVAGGLDGVLFFGVAQTATTFQVEWHDALPSIVNFRLSGLALKAIRAGVTDAPDSIVASLTKVARAEAARTLAVEAFAVKAMRALEDAGAQCVCIKGPGIARHYDDPTVRPFADLDLLVGPSQFRLALAALEGLGLKDALESVDPRRYFLTRCFEGINLVGNNGAAIDLHHHIPPWIWGRDLNVDRLRSSSVVTETGLRVAGLIHQLLIVALHLISDKAAPGRDLMIWRDLATLSHLADPEATAVECRALGLGWLLRIALEGLPEHVRPTALVRELAGEAPRRAGAYRLERLIEMGDSNRIGLAYRLPIRNALAFLAGALFPSRNFLVDRYGSRWAYGKRLRDLAGRSRRM